MPTESDVNSCTVHTFRAPYTSSTTGIDGEQREHFGWQRGLCLLRPCARGADLKVDTFHRAREKDLLAAVPRSSLMQRLIKTTLPDTGQ